MEAWRFGFGDRARRCPATSSTPPTPTSSPCTSSRATPTSAPSSTTTRRASRRGSSCTSTATPTATTPSSSAPSPTRVRTAAARSACGQKGAKKSLTLLSPDGRELDIQYKRYNLSYCLDGEEGTTGWVMHEYEITSPPLPGAVLSCIRVADRGKWLDMQGMQWQLAAAEPLAAGSDQQVFPDPEKPGPSHQYHAGLVAGNAIVMGDGLGFSGAQTDAARGDNGGGMGETGGYYTSLHYAGQGGGDYSNYYNAGGGDFSNYYIAGDGDDNIYYEASGDVNSSSTNELFHLLPGLDGVLPGQWQLTGAELPKEPELHRVLAVSSGAGQPDEVVGFCKRLGGSLDLPFRLQIRWVLLW